MVKSSLLLGLAVLLLTAAGEPPAALQAGYAAYLRGEYEVALRQYEVALQQSPEPGRIAGELGAIAAQAGRYAEASTWFSRAMEDATGSRRVQACYGQATAMIHVAASLPGRRAVSLLKQALLILAAASREAKSLSTEELATLSTMQADIQHNQSVAEALLKQKQQEPEPPENEDDKQPEATDPLQPSPAGGNSKNDRRATPLNGKNDGATGNENSSTESSAGRGNLPPLPDDEKTPPISRSEAERRLEQLRLRLKQPLSKQPLRPGSKDW